MWFVNTSLKKDSDDMLRDSKSKSEFLSVFFKSMVITLSVIALVLIGYFTAGFLSGGL